MFKKILSYVVVLTLVVSYFTYNVSASEDDSISLPVELFDFDADGLFYEYVWGHGMNLYGKGNYEEDAVTKGLVEETLGQDGRPVYTRDAVESAARTIQENLFAGYSDENFKARAYTTFSNFINHTPATNIDYSHANLFGKFFDEEDNDSWSLYGSPSSTIVNHKIEDKWKKDGENAIVCQEASSIVYKEAIPRGQAIKLRYYVCYPGFEQKQFSIDFIDENNNSIKHVNLVNGSNSYYNTYVEIPEGNGNVYLKLNGQTNTLIADMTISSAPILPLGNYDKTVSKYNAGNLTTIEQCTSCMDYAYLRLKNFFNTNFIENHEDDAYTSMKLNKNVTRNAVSYSFDSDIQTIYDSTNKTFYNTSGSSNGFFPLDHTGTEHLNQIENDENSKHNYHFGMIVDGDFIYKKGANQFFDFSGDDDVYVFINNKLVVDLGGAHEIATARINIEEIAEDQGLTNGQKCSFKLFYLERHTSESNCKIQTNLNIGNHVGYNFVSGTEGKELPEEVTTLTPIDNTEYYEGQRVHVTDREFNKVKVEDGTWKFIGWDKNSIQVFTENTFVGTWVFTPNSVDDENNDSATEDEDETPTIEGNDKDDKKPEVTDNKDTDNKDTNNKVKTGDSTVVSVYLVMMMVACLGLVHILKKD